MKAKNFVLRFIFLLLLTGCYSEDDELSPPKKAPSAAPMSATASEPQIWMYVESHEYNWVVKNSGKYTVSSITQYDLNVHPDKAVYTSSISDISTPGKNVITISMGTHEYISPCDSTEIMNFFSAQWMYLSASGTNLSNGVYGASVDWTDWNGFTWTSNGLQNGSSFKILDRFFYENSGTEYVKVHINFHCKMFNNEAVFQPRNMIGEGIFIVENSN